MSNLREFHLVVTEEGARLDKYVSQHYPEISRTQVQKLIGDGNIRVNDRTARAGLKLSAGDRLTINLTPP
ncbi:MAG: S4 domain-containing protein, partial [Dehalococcoidales bacterium]|nr:S4 domain-containing protein [Dehalococcoidales bacterium]